MSLPGIVQVRVIEGRALGPHLLLSGGVHGDEFEPMAALRQLARVLDPAQLRGRVTLVPVANEPAFLRGQRTAEDALDLARVCPGRDGGSVTERVAHALSALIRSADYYIDLHTGGVRLSVLPMTGYTLHPDPGILERQRGMARAFNLPLIWGTDPNLEGRTLSVARDAGVPAIYAEYQGGGRCDPAGVAAYVAGCLNVLGYLGMLTRELPVSAVQHVVEDSRPESGHMQVCNPAPVTGFFEPAVRLGQWVQTGDLLGTVSDVLGERVVEVVSRQTGLVLVLQTFARVLEGDSLAVILDLPEGDRLT